MSFRLLTVCALVAAALSACKGDSVATIPATTTVAPATTTTTTKEHGFRVQYLNAVSGINCLNDRVQATYTAVGPGRDYFTQADWPRIRAELIPVIKAFGDGMVSFYQDLARLEWPPNAAEDIKILTRQSTADASAALAQAEAKTYDDFIALPGPVHDGAQAAAVRAILGLPTNLVEDNYDWCQGPPKLDPAPLVSPATTTSPPATVG